ncbi:MAG TPA: hypothetical protein VGF21_08170 [Thermoleophilaceae bacterium]|jgi:hypothetical protein
MSHSKEIIVRSASDADYAGLARLAALDSARPLSGDALVAESDARLIAALPLGSGRPIADPFEPSAQAVALLELRAEQLRNGRSAPRRMRDRVRDLLRAPLPG